MRDHKVHKKWEIYKKKYTTRAQKYWQNFPIYSQTVYNVTKKCNNKKVDKNQGVQAMAWKKIWTYLELIRAI